MKLKLKNGEIIEVKFWSFVKCVVLVQLTMMGITYGVMGICLLIYGLTGGL